MGFVTVNGLLYFLEISPYLEILPPSNVAASFCQLAHPINAAIEILPHGKGLMAIHMCTRNIHAYIIIEAAYMYVRACRSL